MKLEIRTILLMLSAAIALTTACKKTPIPSEDPQPSVVEFRTKSQAAWVKTQSEPQMEVFPYDNFGVWGMARQEADGAVYNLWGNTALAEVSRNQETNLFEPAIAAYWLRGYTYNFLAVAPYNDGGLFFSGVSTKEEQTNATSPSDRMTFTYDMSGKYDASNYDFDLMAASAETQVAVGSAQGQQSLIFWHLVSQIIFRVKFGNDQSGKQIEGQVQKLTLKNIRTSASYEITAGDEDKTIAVTCAAMDSPVHDFVSETSETISANEPWSFIDSVNILPQDISDFQLFIDFTIGNGDYDGYEVNLSSAGDNYDFNERYFWNITIGHNLYISMDAEVAPWDDNNGSKYPADGEIIM